MAVTFTLTVMDLERATPNDESTSAYGVRRLAAALGSQDGFIPRFPKSLLLAMPGCSSIDQ